MPRHRAVGTGEVPADEAFAPVDDDRGVAADAVAEGLPHALERGGVDDADAHTAGVPLEESVDPVGDALEVGEQVGGEGIGGLATVDALRETDPGERHLAVLAVAEDGRRVCDHLNGEWTHPSASPQTCRQRSIRPWRRNTYPSSSRETLPTLGRMELPEPRPDLLGFQAYRTQQTAAEVRLQANEWPEPNPADQWLTPAELRDVLLNRYPAGPTELRSALAERYGVAPEQLVLGNGSNEVLLNTFLVFGGHGRRTLLFQPTYSMHGRLTTIAGGTVVDEHVGLPYAITTERALAAAARVAPNVVVFTTPNNPTGSETAFETILAVAQAHPQALVLVDEAYADFSGRTIVPAIATRPNLVVSRTFSKARAAAGLRLGVLITHPAVTHLYRAVQLPYNVSALTSAVAARLARDDGAVARRVAQCASERERVYAALRGLAAVEAHPSVTNFILFRVKDGDAAAAHARLLERGVLIRDVSAWPGCAGCLRVSIGTALENDRFVAALGSVFGRVSA